MNKNKKLWMGVISFILACLVFMVFVMIQFKMQEEVVYEEVIFAKVSVNKNTLITEQNVSQYFERKAMPMEWLPEEYVSDTADIYGRVVITDMTEGTIVTGKNIKAYDSYYDEYEQLTWISIPINELFAGVAGTLRPGDFIDIYSLYEMDDMLQCSLLAEHVRIATTYSQSGESISTEDDQGLSQLIVIPIEKEQVSLFYTSLAQGKIRIAKY